MVENIDDGSKVILDGDTGEITADPTEEVIASYQEKIKKQQEMNAYYSSLVSLPAVTTDGVRVELMPIPVSRMVKRKSCRAAFSCSGSTVSCTVPPAGVNFTALERRFMGATAVGTGLNAEPAYIVDVAKELSAVTGETYRTADNLIDATNNTDGFADVSSALKVTALVLIKMANDFRLMEFWPSAKNLRKSNINIPPIFF